jgi:hypothetical protein
MLPKSFMFHQSGSISNKEGQITLISCRTENRKNAETDEYKRFERSLSYTGGEQTNQSAKTTAKDCQAAFQSSALKLFHFVVFSCIHGFAALCRLWRTSTNCFGDAFLNPNQKCPVTFLRHSGICVQFDRRLQSNR